MFYFHGDREREAMNRTIELARLCKSEPGKISPKVAALVMSRDGDVLAEAYRGELRPGDHAEYTLLEGKLADVDLQGATIFTTLEPCTVRSPNKTPCCTRIINRGFKRVYIGTLDPDSRIRGSGELQLQEAGIEVLRYGHEMAKTIRNICADFWHKNRLPPQAVPLTDLEGQTGPNGYRLGYTSNGDLAEWIPDDSDAGEVFPLILRRNDKDIHKLYAEFWDKVWWNRHMYWLKQLESGERTLDPAGEPLLERAKRAAKAIEDKYGRENLGWNDVDWGILQGRFSALAWVLGAEWDESLDT